MDRMTALQGEIGRIESGPESLLVWLAEPGAAETAQPLELPWFWVRDHSEDSSTLDPGTKQRTIDSFAIDRSIRPVGAEIIDGTIHVRWGDGSPTSIIGGPVLATLSPRSDPDDTTPPGVTLWPRGDDVEVPVLDADEVLGSDDGLRRWLDVMATWGFGLVRGCGTDIDDAEALANRIGYVRRTVFGAMWTLSSEVVAHDDSAYGNDTLAPHTDGSYSHDGPGLQFFVCSERTGTGGESVLVDGLAAVEALKQADPDAFEILTEVSVPARYLEHGVHLEAARPTIRLDRSGRVVQVTLNNYDRAPFLLPPAKLSAWYDAYRALHELVNDESAWWTTRLEPGDGLFLDNWRCLHGRLAYTGRRIFHGGYINHEDYESRLRTMGLGR